MWGKLRALIIKEFIAIWQDKRSRMALIIPPMMQFFIFTFAATLDVNNVSLGLLNKDQGKLSYEFTQRLKGSPKFKEIVYLDSEQELKKAMDSGKVLVAVAINEDFSSKILSHAAGDILVVADGRKSNAAQIVLGYITEISQKFNMDLAKKQHTPLPKTELKPRNWYNPNLIYTWFTVTGLIGILSMLASVSITSLSIAREKEMGTFEQLLVSPLSPWLILIGKAIPALFIGVVEGSVMLLAGIVFLELPVVGNLFLFYIGMVIFVLAIVGIGLFISSLSNTQQQSTMGVFLCMSPMVIMSGFATPIANMPVWLQYFAYLNPLKYFLIIARGTCLKNISTLTVINNIWPMLLIACCTISIAAWFFRKKIG